MKNTILSLAFVAALMTSCKNNDAATTEPAVETADSTAVVADSAAVVADSAAVVADSAATPATEEVKEEVKK
ncbi:MULTISPECIES: hypothetical protein [unclassified Flavobacterium]|uniref:hypothetical protein n=1 Tax=unclassified Flavobacterium TaxID=196869 RepID=UPI00360F42AC